MSNDEAIADILLDWEDLRDEGKEPSAMELCRDHPDLVAEVERRIQALRKMYGIPNRAAAEPQPSPATRDLPARGGLPQVPDYEVLELLGSGGMGKVFKARQLSLKRLVALKMILTGYAATAEEAERFRIEAEAAAALQHPNIVQIYQIGSADSCPYLAMEFVDGENLAQRLQSGPLPPRQAAGLVRTLARAMHYAHQHGIIHRDLKPANVLLQNDEGGRMNDDSRRNPSSDSSFILPPSSLVPKITDFGLAKRLDDLSQTRTGSVLGTPSYMAPEQAEGQVRQVGPRSDIYALGAILYECLTGRPPFDAPTLLETLEMVRSQDPLPPRRLHPEIGPDLETICLKCLQKDPAQRFESAEALADDLSRYLEGEPIRARNPSLLDRLTWTLNRTRGANDLLPSSAILGTIAPMPFFIQLATFVLASGRPNYPWIAFWVTLASVVVLVGLYFILSGDVWRIPLNTTTRHLWSIRVGQILGLSTMPVISWLLHPAGRVWDPLTVFPLWTIQSGITFFALGGLYWGRFYLLGLSFVAASMLMPLWLEFAPLGFSFLISLTLTLGIYHARRWQAEQVSTASDSLSRRKSTPAPTSPLAPPSR